MTGKLWSRLATRIGKLLLALPPWLRYAYYLRFSIILWLFPLVLAYLNETSARSLTGGILVPEAWEQFTCVAFFLISSGLAALIIARVVIINGKDRFETLPRCQNSAHETDNLVDPAAPPPSLCIFLNGDDSSQEAIAVAESMLPTLLIFGYLIWNGTREGVPWWITAIGLACGTILAFLFWIVVNILYYLIYRIPVDASQIATVQLGKTAARTILFPRRLFKLPLPGEPLRMDTIEAARPRTQKPQRNRLMRSLGDAAVRRFAFPGYVYPGTSHLFEAQFFSIVALSGFVLIYLVIWPLTAPVPTPLSWAAIAALLIAGAFVIRTLFAAQRPDGGPLRVIPYSVFTVALFTLVFPTLYLVSDAERFPVFASILVAVTMFMWILAVFAFFLDRFRVPVFTLILLIVILPRWFNLDFGTEEHYLSITTTGAPAAVPTPAEILQKWIADKNFNPDEPVVIVTATGGGLHASAWTAAVLGQLESQFHHDFNQSLYSHVLLISTVSGGSVGVMNYLQAKRAPGDNYDAAQVSAGCSSLEAVGWGIIYHDLPASFFLPLSWVFGSSSGIDDLDDSPLAKDRTWALRKGFERNLQDHYCNNLWNKQRNMVWLKTVQNDFGQAQKTEESLSLRALTIDPHVTPALTMNTTTSERGDRFLLANYAVPHYKIGSDEAFPAESFLQIFGTQNLAREGASPVYADLPLATAAQLSATFPYVSSAARFPEGRNIGSSHFIDGGYYDNDGTASILEFLRYALDDPGKSTQQIDPANAAALQAVDQAYRAKGKHLRVILVEIRNSADDPAVIDNDSQAEAPSAPGNLLFQLNAPLSGFWNAGHTSVTARNRAALDLIEDAYADRLQVSHIVIADTSHVTTSKAHKDLVESTDPLNWSLTPKQREEIKDTSTKVDRIQQKYKDASAWMHKSDADWKQLLDAKHPTRAASR